MWLEDVAESREPYVVQLSGPNPRVRKVQMVLLTLLELNGPVPKLMAWEPRLRRGDTGSAHAPSVGYIPD